MMAVVTAPRPQAAAAAPRWRRRSLSMMGLTEVKANKLGGRGGCSGSSGRGAPAALKGGGRGARDICSRVQGTDAEQLAAQKNSEGKERACVKCGWVPRAGTRGVGEKYERRGGEKHLFS